MTLSAVQSFYVPAVSLTTVPGLTISNLDSTGLRIEWTVTRDNTNNPDGGEVVAYNLSPSIIGTIYASWQAIRAVPQVVPSFTLSIGWNRVPQVVMAGDIVNFIPLRRTATDVQTVWQIGDATERQRDAVVGRDFHNVNVQVVLDYLISLPPAPTDAGGGGLGLLFPAESKTLITAAAAEVPLQAWSNITKGQNVKEAVDAIMETLGLEWRIHNGAFIAMRGGIIDRPGPTISPGSGLISYTPRDDGGIEFEALADTRFEPGIRCTVLGNLGKPIGSPSYRVESVTFTGSTDENSIMAVVGRRPLGLQAPSFELLGGLGIA